ncbi:MAG TPA: hypothetical protein VHA06_01825 [Candidatus Angelobacter sp.]|jgi:hypothetical protein|nr:hypothetical protein [Candidatus Angelobacter sp.]
MQSRLVIFLFVASLLQAIFALPIQPQNNAPGPGDPGYKPGSGTTLCVDVPRALDAKKLKVDEEIITRVTDDLIYDGKVIVARESKVFGKVVDLKVATKEDPETRLLLEFTKIATKDGREFDFEYPAFIQALAPERRAAAFSTNISDMPVKAEMGKALDRSSTMPTRSGDKNSVLYGVIAPQSIGVFGFHDLKLDDSSKGSYIVAKKGNIKLEYGAQFVLRVAAPAK